MRLFDEINLFVELFDGNRAAVGREEGGCERLVDPADWEMWVEGHLRGANPPIGVYPMEFWPEDDTWVVKWGCIDFDEGEQASWDHARNVHGCLAQFGVTSWIERSRSKGYHVWVFLSDWTDADTVRRGLLATCQIVGAPTKEINPKQSELEPEQLGNYVRLPYPEHLQWEGGAFATRRTMVDPETGTPLSLSWFVDNAHSNLVSESKLVELGSYYIAPLRSTQSSRDWTKLAGDAVDRLAGKTKIIFEQGPLEHPDSDTNYRGHTLWKLARLLFEDRQHSPEEVLELLRDADARWGKFHERPDGERRLAELVAKAIGAL